MSIMKCIEAKIIETYNGYYISREVDKKWNEYTGEYEGHAHVFYCVSDEDLTIECFKTLREARAYLKELL